MEAEMASEYAKEVVWDKNTIKLEDQFYISAKQNRRVWRLRDQVDFIISDSPLLLGIHYAPPNYFPEFYRDFIWELWSYYDNLNFVLNRVGPYNPNGRYQTEEEAKQIDNDMVEMLESNSEPYKRVDQDKNVIDQIYGELFDESGNFRTGNWPSLQGTTS